jgi:hypothetical protein
VKLAFFCTDKTAGINAFQIVLVVLSFVSLGLVVYCSWYYQKHKQDVPDALRRAPQAPGQRAQPLTELSRAEIREWAKKTKLEDINKALITT